MPQKTRSIISILILSSLSGVSFYLGVIEVVNYLKYYDVVVFSWMSLLLLFVPIVIFFPLAWFIALLFKGFNSAVSVISRILPAFKFICMLVVVISISLSYWYIATLNNKGYIKCKGIPTGWMPGMATRYALNEALCKKRLILYIYHKSPLN